MKCCCGHSESHHNPAPPYNDIKNDFSGNCRNCKCSAFTRELPPPVCDQFPVVHGLIARRRGEYIVRRWNDEVEGLKIDHAIELAKKDVMLKEQKRLMRISNRTLTDLEVYLKKFGGHTADCATNKIYTLRYPLATCDCGFLKAEKRWKLSEREG